MKIKKQVSILLCTVMIIQCLFIIPAKAYDNSKMDTFINIAKEEVGYMETTYEDGTFYSKYGDWYGLPNGAWCAMFVSWCANEAGIPYSIIPKFASTAVGKDWFVNKELWRDKSEYSPQPGDLIFLNNCSHVGIVEKCENNVIYTIEGNASDSNGENFGVRQRTYDADSSKITGYGVPDMELFSKLNGKALRQSTAYMLADGASSEVWEIWEDDDLEVLCRDGNYYLVMYPFLNSGKFVCAYVDKDAVETFDSIPNADDFYSINQSATTNTQAYLYHNPSDSALLSNSGVDKKIRGTLNKDAELTVLFEKDNYYFVKSGNTTGFISKSNVNLNTAVATNQIENVKLGDVDRDGEVTIMDAARLQLYMAKLLADTDVCDLTVADYDCNGDIDIMDAALIQLVLAGLAQPVNPNDPSETVTVPEEKTEISDIVLPEELKIELGQSENVYYNILPENATDKTLYWLSSDEDVVSASDDGVIIGKGVGTAKVTVVAANGTRASVAVTVLPNTVNPQSITIDNTKPDILYTGNQLKLNATVYPENTTDNSVIWISSNPDIASVDENGLVTANTAGTATVTAMSADASVSATSEIRVNQMTSYIGNGTYCFKLKGTNSYLDHQGGTTNGTNVHLWSGDGDSNVNQKIVTDRIDDHRYMLRSASSTDLLIDLNRGSSYSDPIQVGKNIDLWQNNDWEAQEWLFTKTYDGYYIIRLNMFQGGAIEASGTANGSNIYLGAYNPENDMQKWQVVDTTAYTIPERTAWVYNTGDVGNLNVRSGPGTNYASIGGFNEGQQITVIGDLAGDWYKVRGANRHDGNTITGYSHKDYITFVKPSQSVTDPDNAAPNLYSSSYNATKNPFAQSNLYGQCTWYAWGRANEVKGKSLPCRGDAKTWYSVAKNNGYSVGSTPKKNSIAVWSSGTYGHVAYVEKVSGNNVTITESNWDKTTYNYQYSIESGIYYYSGYKTLTVSQMNSRFGTLLGYIYL